MASMAVEPDDEAAAIGRMIAAAGAVGVTFKLALCVVQE
jgi:hypothetical protein